MNTMAIIPYLEVVQVLTDEGVDPFPICSDFVIAGLYTSLAVLGEGRMWAPYSYLLTLITIKTGIPG